MACNWSRVLSSDSEEDSELLPGRSSVTESSAGRLSFVQKYVLEAVVMTYVLYNGLITIPLTDAIMQKSCSFELAYNDSICQNLKATENSEYLDQVHKITKYYGLAINIAGSLPAAVTSIIAGQFIARYGMKAPVLCAIIASGVTCLCQLYSFADMALPPYYNVIFAIPQALAGGLPVILTAVQTRITLTTHPDERKNRFFLLRYLIFIPNLIANAVGAPLYKAYGAAYLSILICGALLVPLILMITVFQDQGMTSTENFCEALRNSVNFNALKDSFTTLKRKRPGHARAQIYFMLICLTTAMVPYAGTDNLEQLYVNKLYGWDATTFALISTYSMAALFVTTIVLYYIFTRACHLSDPVLMLIGYSSYTCKLLAKPAMSLGEFMFWIQLALGAPLMIGSTAAGSHLTRLLAASETAVVFALSSSCERVIPVLLDICFSAIYASTVGVFPGSVFLFEAFLFLFPVVFAVLCLKWLRSEGYPDYTKLEEES